MRGAQLVPVKVGQWAVLELPGRLVQGRVAEVTESTVRLEGQSARYSRRYVVSSMGRMTRDPDGTVKQNPKPKGRTMATKKRPTAKQLAARALFAKRAKAGDFSKPKRKRATNPLSRVKKTGRSMATGKKPSARLAKRRARTAAGPKGFYANPRNKGAHKVATFEVRKVSHGVAGELLASFPGTAAGKARAAQYAQALANSKGTKVLLVGRR